jgi:NAD(P)-dependent dehydrogenase (short-subunit alcohol dehydrogenase family)
MPLPFLAEVAFKGLPYGIDGWKVFQVLAVLGLLVLVKWYTRGAVNTSERQMHSKVVMITVSLRILSISLLSLQWSSNISQGGTTGIGAATTLALAQRGAQIILLTRAPPTDPFLADYIEDLRERTKNELIYAEQCDLSSLHSIRKFATKWIDNAPPRRLDMIILCGATLTPPGKERDITEEGVEETWQVNYLANFHLLSILTPAIKAQPPDRDVRIIFTTCSSYISSPTLKDGEEAMDANEWSPSKAYARSKLALMVFGSTFQKHLDSYKRPDGAPVNSRVVFVDPGYTRTPGMRRWLTRGSLWGLGIYLLAWQNVWLWLKSSEQGAQSVLYAAMDVSLGRGAGGKLVKECIEVDFARKDVKDEEIAKKLWEGTEKLIERVEREAAVQRAYLKKQKEEEQKDKGGKDGASENKETADTAADGKKAKPRRGRKKAA